MPGKSVFWRLHFRELYQLMFSKPGEKYQLTETEMEILLFLRDDSVYNTARDICVMQRIAKSNVSNAIRMLERKGYLRIQIDEENKKIHRLFLTEKSKPVVEILYQVQKDYMAKLVGNIADERIHDVEKFFEECDANARREIEVLRV